MTFWSASQSKIPRVDDSNGEEDSDEEEEVVVEEEVIIEEKEEEEEGDSQDEAAKVIRERFCGIAVIDKSRIRPPYLCRIGGNTAACSNVGMYVLILVHRNGV